jgi:hypothetical protein
MRVVVVGAAVLSLLVPSLSLAASSKAPPPSPPAVEAPPPVEAPKPPPLPPATPERLALARRIMAADGGAAGLSAMAEGLVEGFVSGVKPGPEVMTLFGPYKTRALASLRVHMPQIVDALAVAWARVYTEDELKAQLAYFEQPTTRSIVSKLPTLASQLGLEVGWAVRQIILNDPGTRKYLADVTPGVTTEPSPRWAAPPPEVLAGMRERIAKTPGGADFLDHPEKFMDDIDKADKKAGGKNHVPDKYEKQMKLLVPQLFRDIVTIFANNFTLEEMDAQAAFTKSPAGLAMALKFKFIGEAAGDDLKAIFKEIGQDVMRPSQTVEWTGGRKSRG